MPVDQRLLEQWRRSQEKEQFERRVGDAVAYVERRVAALRSLEDVRGHEARPGLRLAEPPR